MMNMTVDEFAIKAMMRMCYNCSIEGADKPHIYAHSTGCRWVHDHPKRAYCYSGEIYSLWRESQGYKVEDIENIEFATDDE